MADWGQGWLRLGAAVLACAGTPALAQQKEERSLDVRLNASALWDGNAARSGRAQAAARGLAREEMEYRPSASAAIVLPFDQHGFFADADVGYEFHSRNRRLEHERIAAQGGIRLHLSRCTATLSGRYARRLSELADSYSDAVGNIEQVAGGSGKFACDRPVGLSPILSASHESARNALPVRKRSDVDTLSLSAGLAWQQPAIGRLTLTGAFTHARYPNRFAGAREDSVRTWAGTLGIERTGGAHLRGSLSIGYIAVDPDLPGVPSYSGMSYGAALVWLPGGPARLELNAARSIEASNRVDVSYYRQDQIALALRYVLGPRLNAGLDASWRRRRYAASPALPGATPPGADRSYSAGASLGYALNRRVLLTLTADYQRRDATLAAFDYGGARVGLSASYQM